MSDRWYAHYCNEDETPLWRHGRAWLTIRGAGRRTPHSQGKRTDLEFHAEWRTLVARGDGFGLGASLKWGTNGSESTPDVSLHLSRLGDIWLGVGNLIPYRWLERHKPDGRVDYDTRVFSVEVDGRGFRWECWARANHWSRSDPWWMSRSWEWERLCFGRTKVESEVVASGVTVVPMPERSYDALWSTTRHERAYTGPLGRVRDALLGRRHHYTTEVTPSKAVPVPGKGENAWDCGDNHISSLSTGGRSVEKAVGALVESALRDRRRYGGEAMSTPVAS